MVAISPSEQLSLIPGDPDVSGRVGPAASFTLWRVGVLLAVAGVLWLIGVRSWALVFVAVLVSLPVSLFVLRKKRAEFARDLRRRREERAQLRAKLQGDALPPDNATLPADDATLSDPEAGPSSGTTSTI